MTAKAQFLANEKLKAWWSKIVEDEKFDQVMLHASAIALEGCPSSDQRDGVLAFKMILSTMPEAESSDVLFAKPGLSHDLEPKRKTVEEPTPKPDKK